MKRIFPFCVLCQVCIENSQTTKYCCLQQRNPNSARGSKPLQIKWLINIHLQSLKIDFKRNHITAESVIDWSFDVFFCSCLKYFTTTCFLVFLVLSTLITYLHQSPFFSSHLPSKPSSMLCYLKFPSGECYLRGFLVRLE